MINITRIYMNEMNIFNYIFKLFNNFQRPNLLSKFYRIRDLIVISEVKFVEICLQKLMSSCNDQGPCTCTTFVAFAQVER